MPRNSSGTYTLPQAAYTDGQVITAAIVNSNFSDIATALTQSLSSTGVTTMTGPIIGTAGSVSAPSYTFSGSTGTGFYLVAANQIGWAANGVQGATFNSDKSVTWAGNQSFGGTIAVTGAATLSSTLAAGNTTITGTLAAGNTTITGTQSVSGKASFTSTDSMALPNGTTGQRNGSPSTGDFRYNSTTSSVEYWNGSNWIGLVSKLPTVQTFTSSSGTYTPSSGFVRIRVRMVGGGGGGGAEFTNNGSDGSTTTFGTWTTVGGSKGLTGSAVGGAGGSGGTNGTGTLIVRIAGAAGNGSPIFTSTGASGSGGAGGSSPFGGAGAPADNTAGGSAAANTGSGGAGAGIAAGNGSAAGGGGAGEYAEFYMSSAQVGASLSYSVGGGGNGGTAGTLAGGAGGSGVIIVEEFYI